MPDYIPSPDGTFDAWQANFVTYATANAAALGLDPALPCAAYGWCACAWIAGRINRAGRGPSGV